MQHQDPTGRTDRKTNKEGFWSLFTLARDGRLKSTMLLYAFALSFVFVVVYVVFFGVLLEPLDKALANRMSTGWVNAVEIIVPTLGATALCMLAFWIAKEKRIVPIAYAFLLLYALLILLALVFTLEGEERTGLLRIYALFIPIPVLTGCLTSFMMYARYTSRRRKQMNGQ